MVSGAIRAHRVKVYTSWADFVFEKNYKLPTLKEVEDHIAKNGHLNRHSVCKRGGSKWDRTG